MDPRIASTLQSLAACIVIATCTATHAQEVPVAADHEEVALERPEGWAMAFMSSAILFQGFGPPRGLDSWSVRAGAELASIPHIDREDRRIGFDGEKLEDLNKSPVSGRLRAWLGLPAGLALELAWTPPVSINGARPDGIFGLAIEREIFRHERWRAGARLFAQTGHVKGDITCPAEVASRPLGGEDNPYGCRAPSDDDFSVDQYGLELTGSATFREGTLEPFASFTLIRLDAEVHVDALVFGVRDRSVRSTEGTLRTFRAGLVHRPAERWEWSVSADYTPLDVRRPPDRGEENDPFWSVRLMARYAF